MSLNRHLVIWSFSYVQRICISPYQRPLAQTFIVPQCSVSCGNGKRERTVECSGGRGKCDSKTKPQSPTSCNPGPCPKWEVGDWSQVKFIRWTYFEGRGNFNVDKWMWKHFIKMSPNRHLVIWSFSYVQRIWISHYQGPIVQSFIVAQCSVSCGNGKRERTVECSGGRGKCNSKTKPQATTRCNLGSCPEWKAGDWSQVY